MSNNEFYQTISIDVAPHESRCEWCGQPAVQQLTAIGGRYHNESGFFCPACGEEFIHAVNSPTGEIPPSRPPIPSQGKGGRNSLLLDHVVYREPAEEKEDSDSLPIPLD